MTAEPAETTTRVTLVPPRPNLGPEPYNEPAPSWPWVVGPGVAVGMVAVWVVRKATSRRRRWAVGNGGDTRKAASPDEPGAAIVGLAETARAALVERFGTPWWAKTTEEVADDPELAAALGRETAERLVALLRKADRVKFDGTSAAATQGDDEEWAGWVAGFAAGARSTISGK